MKPSSVQKFATCANGSTYNWGSMGSCNTGHAVLHQQLRKNIGKAEMMFVVLLRFSANKAKAPELMDAYNAWINRGIEDGVFRVVGSLQP